MNPESLPTATRTLSPETVQRYMLALNELASTLSIYSFKPIDVTEFCKRHDIKPSFFDALRDLNKLEMDMTKLIGECNFFKMDKELYAVTPDEIVAQMRRNGHKTAKKQVEVVEQAQAEVSVTESIKVVDLPKPCNFAGSDCPNSICSICKDAASKSGIAEDIKNTLERVHVPPISQRRKEIDVRMPIAQEVKQLQESVKSLNSLTSEHPVIKELQQLREEVENNLPTEPQQLITPFNVSIQSKGLSLTMEVFTTEDQDIVNAVLDKLSRVK